MRAVRIKAYGGPEVLDIVDLSDPKPGPAEVLVRMKHTGVNVMDVKTRNGDYDGAKVYGTSLPTQLGMEGAGIVEAVGTDVRDVAVGDRVAYCLVWNSYAELAVVPAWRLAPVPNALPLAVAGTSTFQGFTAHYLVNDVARLVAGSTCLIHAAAGGVGAMMVALAARKGARVFATVRTDDQKRAASERGASEVMLSQNGAFVDPILEATAGRGVDVVFDSIGKPTLRDDLRIVRRKGLIVNFGASAGSVDDLDPAELGEAGSVFLTRPRLDDYLPDASAVRARATDLYAQMIDGGFGVAVAAHYGFEQVRRAYEDLAAGKVDGKACLDFA